VLFLSLFMYYFVHPEAYRMRPLDPLIGILECQTILAISLRRQLAIVRIRVGEFEW
jgi:hypothetical protein